MEGRIRVLREGLKFGIFGFLKLREIFVYKTRQRNGWGLGKHSLVVYKIWRRNVCVIFWLLAFWLLRSVHGFRNSHSQIHSF